MLRDHGVQHRPADGHQHRRGRGRRPVGRRVVRDRRRRQRRRAPGAGRPAGRDHARRGHLPTGARRGRGRRADRARAQGQVGARPRLPPPAGRPATPRRTCDGSMRRWSVGCGSCASWRRPSSASSRISACQLFTVLGTAGVGKSRLIAAFLEQEAGDALVLRGRCLPYGQNITFWPIGEIVRAAAGIHADDDMDSAAEPTAGAPRTTTPRPTWWPSASARPSGWRRWMPRSRRRSGPSGGSSRRSLAIGRWSWSSTTCTGPRPRSSISSSTPPTGSASHRSCCVTMGRPEFLDSRPAWGGGKLNATTILLEPLSEIEAEELVAQLVGETGLDVRLRRRISDAAEGNPLFVEELVAMLVDDGVLRSEGGQWVVAGDLSGVAVPPTIAALIAARLDRLALRRSDGHGTGLGHRPGLLASGGQRAARRHRARRARPAAGRPRPPRAHPPRSRDGLLQRRLPLPPRAHPRRRLRSALQGGTGRAPPSLRGLAGADERRPPVRDRGHRRPPPGAGGAPALRARARSTGRTAKRPYAVPATWPRRAAGPSPGATCRPRSGSSIAPRSCCRPTSPAAPRCWRRSARRSPSRATSRRAADVFSGAEEAERQGGDVEEAYTSLTRLHLFFFTDPDGVAEATQREVERLIPLFEARGDELGMAKARRRLAMVYRTRRDIRSMEAELERAIVHARAAGDTREEARSLGLLATAAFMGPTPVADGIERCRRIRAEAAGNRIVERAVLPALAGLTAMAGDIDGARAAARRAQPPVRRARPAARCRRGCHRGRLGRAAGQRACGNAEGR